MFFLRVFEALCLLAAFVFVFALLFPGKIHTVPEGYIEEVPEKLASDFLEDSYVNWKNNITNTFEASKN